MKRVTLTYRKIVNHLSQEGRVVEGYHTVALTDPHGGLITELLECDSVDVQEFCVQMKWNNVASPGIHVRAIPLDLIYNIEIEEA